MIAVRKVGIGSVPVIQDIAGITWPVAYGGLLSPQQFDYMMEQIYSTASLEKQITDGHQFIIAYEEEQPLAFASYSARDHQPLIYKLHKIYIRPDQQGKGIGRLLIDFIKKDIAPVNILQLNVNRRNKAIHFYQKTGFKIIAEEDIDIGNGYFMNDYIMELKW